MDKKVLVMVNQPSSPKGTEFNVPGLGLFKNGVPRLITDDDLATWNSFQPVGQTVPPAAPVSDEEDRPEFQTERGQVLSQAFAGSPHLSVVEEDVEALQVPDDEEPKAKKKSATVKSSAPVGKKGTDAEASEGEE